MFGFLKKSLKKGMEKLKKKAEEAPEIKEKEIEKEEVRPVKEPEEIRETEKPEVIEEPKPVPEKEVIEKKITEPEVPEKKEEKTEEIGREVIRKEPKPVPEEKKPRKLGIREKLTKKMLSAKDIDDFFSESETELLGANVAMEVMDFLKKYLKERLAEKPVKRGEIDRFITETFRESLLEVVDQGKIDLEGLIKKAKREDRPLVCIFLGFNGSGKTTTIAKLAKKLLDKGYKPVLAAGDTFRAAAQEQIEILGDKLGVKVIKHKYGADSAAVIFDAVKFAKGRHYDVVLADTAGRTHTDKNLMDELRKVVRVNSPDLRILVVDSLTGNDVVEQAREFDGAVGVNAIIPTKTDVNEKGGAILSACYITKKPILFLGMGQGMDDLKEFRPEEFVEQLVG